MAQATYSDDSQQTQVISQNQMETIEENKKKIQKIVDAKNDNKPVLNRKIEMITKNTNIKVGFFREILSNVCNSWHKLFRSQ